MADALRVMLLVVHEARRRVQEASLRAQRLLTSGPQLHAYLHTVMAHERVEQIRVLYVDKEHYLLEDVLMGQGTVIMRRFTRARSCGAGWSWRLQD